MSKRKATTAPPDRVDLAVAGVRRAVSRLVALLGDEDDSVVFKAAQALAEVGPYAVGPLAAALPGAPSPRHRALIIAALKTFGPQAEALVLRALAVAMERDPDDGIRAVAGAALTALLMAGPRAAR